MPGFLSALRDPWVRALGWSCFSPPLLDVLPIPGHDDSPALPPQLSLDGRRRDWLHSLDSNPAALHRYLAEHCHSRRLGLVFETLWRFFLAADSDTELIAHNLPVRRGTSTLGEFDILYHDRRRNCYCHLELAVKFYLHTPPPAGIETPFSDWLGPDGRDRFDLKMARLQQRQLMLGATAEGREALSRLGVERAVPEVMLNGWLFYRDAEAAVPLAMAHQRGNWTDVESFNLHWRKRHRYWYGLQKPDWLSGIVSGRPLTEAALAVARQRPVMLIGSDDGHEEQLRLFVTPIGWPQQHFARS